MPHYRDAESKVFLVSVKLEPGASADFELAYQMLLPRRRGMYYHPIPIFPGQVQSNDQGPISQSC